jgi:hypothetical protein
MFPNDILVIGHNMSSFSIKRNVTMIMLLNIILMCRLNRQYLNITDSKSVHECTSVIKLNKDNIPCVNICSPYFCCFICSPYFCYFICSPYFCYFICSPYFCCFICSPYFCYFLQSVMDPGLST